MSTTNAREIADWHRAEAQRLRDSKSVASVADVLAGRASIAVDLTDPLDRIKLHERFAAWLEAGEHDEHEKSVARHIAALELTRPPIETIDGIDKKDKSH